MTEKEKVKTNELEEVQQQLSSGVSTIEAQLRSIRSKAIFKTGKMKTSEVASTIETKIPLLMIHGSEDSCGWKAKLEKSTKNCDLKVEHRELIVDNILLKIKAHVSEKFIVYPDISVYVVPFEYLTGAAGIPSATFTSSRSMRALAAVYINDADEVIRVATDGVAFDNFITKWTEFKGPKGSEEPPSLEAFISEFVKDIEAPPVYSRLILVKFGGLL